MSRAVKCYFLVLYSGDCSYNPKLHSKMAISLASYCRANSLGFSLRRAQKGKSFIDFWSSPHLHTVLLEPNSAHTQQKPFPPPPKPYNGTGYIFTNFTPEGKVICRNFNRTKGCNLRDFSFAHVCNRKINGKACAQPHPFYNHPGNPMGGTPSSPSPMGPQ